MGLHDVLLLNDLKYNSPEGLEFVDKMMKSIKNYAYEASVELAMEKGAFPLFDADKFLMSQFVKGLKPTIRRSIKENGIRNGALLTIAPTGTTSMVCEVTSALESMFAAAMERRYYDGEELKMEIVIHPLLKRFLDEGRDVSHFQGAHEISLRDHLEMQRTCQKHVDNAVSKTINIPQGTSIKELSDLYMEYLPELKGVTVYPDGSREDQPLTPIPLEKAIKHAQTASQEARASDSCKSGVCDI
jgi:ribonucleoside-diphosphate reductase alpha chain